MSKSTQKSRVLDMTDGNIARLLLSFAFPIFVGCVLQQVYNLADTAIAGHLRCISSDWGHCCPLQSDHFLLYWINQRSFTPCQPLFWKRQDG